MPRGFDDLPQTRSVVATAHNDEDSVQKTASLTIVDSASPSDSPSPTGSTSATATASASTSPVSGVGDLPVTPGPLAAIAATAVALLTVGGVLLAVTFRRRRQE